MKKIILTSVIIVLITSVPLYAGFDAGILVGYTSITRRVKTSQAASTDAGMIYGLFSRYLLDLNKLTNLGLGAYFESANLSQNDPSPATGSKIECERYRIGADFAATFKLSPIFTPYGRFGIGYMSHR